MVWVLFFKFLCFAEQSLHLFRGLLVRQLSLSANAGKPAVIIWNMLANGQPYQPPTEYLFLDQKRKLKLVSRIRKNIAKFELKPQDVGFDNLLNICN
jgi:hypothetical protein